MSENTKPMTDAELNEIAFCAAEDRTTAGYATPRPWKWWTANSMRSLRSEAGRHSEVVAYGEQHPHDGVIDIAIDEADMALIEHAVNTLERRCDTVVRLVDEVRRLREREAAWQRATRVDDPARVHERNVRLCSCDGADLPQVGDEIDACETCDGIVKAPDDEDADEEPADVPQAPAPRAQWVSRGLRCPFGVQCDRKDACRLWHPLPGNPYAFLPPAEEDPTADPREPNDAGGGP